MDPARGFHREGSCEEKRALTDAYGFAGKREGVLLGWEKGGRKGGSIVGFIACQSPTDCENFAI